MEKIISYYTCSCKHRKIFLCTIFSGIIYNKMNNQILYEYVLLNFGNFKVIFIELVNTNDSYKLDCEADPLNIQKYFLDGINNCEYYIVLDKKEFKNLKIIVKKYILNSYDFCKKMK